MMRRLKRRISIRINAKLILSKKSYTGFTENLSESGIKWYRYTVPTDEPSEYGAYTKTLPFKTALDFNPGTILKLQFKLPSGEKVNLLCKVKWSHVPRLNDSANNIHIDPLPKYAALGMEILNPPPAYKEFFKTLV